MRLRTITYDVFSPGDTAELDDITCSIVDENMLRDMIFNGEDAIKVVACLATDITNLCTQNNSFNLNIGGWYTSNVKCMVSMFNDASVLTKF